VKENDMNERSSTARAALTLILSALALVACDGGSKNSTKTGGSGGGAGGSGGKDGGGLTQPDAGGGGGATGAGTPIKFCNALALQGNQNLRLTLKLGEEPLLLSADSGGCSTAPGATCKTITPGIVKVVLADDADMPIAEGTVTIGAGEEWMVLATLDRMTMEPTVVGGALKAGYTCATLNPFMPPDGGTPNPPVGDAGAGN